MTRRMQIGLAFALGACAGSSAPLVADPAPEPEPPAAPTPKDDGAKKEGTALGPGQIERRASPDGKARIAILAQGDNAFVGRLELDGEVEIPPHRDATEEYIVVLEGAGTLLMDGRAHQLGPGSAVYMPADAEVSFANGAKPMVALQVFAGPEPAEKYQSWKTLD